MSPAINLAIVPAGMATAGLQQAQIDYAPILPMLVVFGAALIGVLVEAFAPRRYRHVVQVCVALAGLVGAFLVMVLYSSKHQGATLGTSALAPDGRSTIGSHPVVIDGPVVFLQLLVLAMAVLAVLTMAERFGGETADAFTQMGSASPGSPTEEAAICAGLLTSEVFPLTMFTVGGMMLFPAAGDLITMFVALEVLSLPLYILSGLARRRRLLSQEAALKYFLLGAFSSAFFLFGAALVYGYAGTVHLNGIAAQVARGDQAMEPLLLIGGVLMLVGLLFKVGAVPFHMWTPDVYQGAPTPVTGFMAAATKAAAFGAILRLLYVGLRGSQWDLTPVLAGIAVLTMVVGAVLSIVQQDVKRILAYSSIAHAGFILVGVIAYDVSAVAAVLFYLAAYGFSTIAAFGVISLVREGGSEATSVAQWSGLGRRHPVVAAVFALLMLSFAGIPLTSGFVAKFAVFSASVAHGGALGAVLAVIGVLASLVTVGIYFRLIWIMYFPKDEPVEDDAAVDGGGAGVLMPSALTTFAIAVGVLVTLVLGVYPSILLDLAGYASQFLP